MSYEGYSQRLCSRGHYWTHDCSIEIEKCPFCKCKSIWERMVDTTNDSGHPARLKIKLQKSCKHCNSILETIYHIPKQRKPHDHQ